MEINGGYRLTRGEKRGEEDRIVVGEGLNLYEVTEMVEMVGRKHHFLAGRMRQSGGGEERSWSSREGQVPSRGKTRDARRRKDEKVIEHSEIIVRWAGMPAQVFSRLPPDQKSIDSEETTEIPRSKLYLQIIVAPVDKRMVE